MDFETARGNYVGLWVPSGATCRRAAPPSTGRVSALEPERERFRYSLAAPWVGDSHRGLSKGWAEAVCWCRKGNFVSGMPLPWGQSGPTWGSGGPRTRRIGPRTASASFLPARARQGMHARAQAPVPERTCTTPEPAPPRAPKRRTVVSKRIFAQCVRAGHSVSFRVAEGDGLGGEVGGGSPRECQDNCAFEGGASGRVDEANERPLGGMRLAAFRDKVVAAPPRQRPG